MEWLKAYDFEYSNIREKSYTELRRELLNIKGIGKETADSILLYAFNYPVFVVDSYTKRFFLIDWDLNYLIITMKYKIFRKYVRTR